MFFGKLRSALKIAALNESTAVERDEIIGIIGVLASVNYPSPLSNDVRNLLSDKENDALYFAAQSEAWDETRQWCETARPELIEIALDLAVHPPNHRKLWNLDAEEWKHHITELLGTWASCNPAQWAEKAGPFLNNVEIRPFVLSSMSDVGPESIVFRPWLKPLINHPEQLSIEEQMYLVEAIAVAGDEESARLLSQLITQVEAGQQEWMSTVEHLKQYMNKKPAA